MRTMQVLRITHRGLNKAVQPEAITGGFKKQPELDLYDRHGKIIADLVFTNFYLGGKASWKTTDIQSIDQALAAAMSDQHLNNVMLQYFRGSPISSTFRPSRVLPGAPPKKYTQARIEKLVKKLYDAGDLDGYALDATVFNFMLPKGAVLTMGGGAGHADETSHKAIPIDETDDSLHGLGGFHGSIHIGKKGSKTIYYAIGVYSQGKNGIVAFDKPWKNVVATFYHELNEARTDPDVEDASKTGSDSYIGWSNDELPSEEIGDIPMSMASGNLKLVMKEVPLTKGGGTVPIQLMWSNYVHGPEGPIKHPHPLAIS
jgi:hypothetical protein